MAHDWTKLYKKYKGLWVALLDDEITVVGSGKNAQTALHEAKKNGHQEPILTRVPDSLAAFVEQSLPRQGLGRLTFRVFVV